MLLQSRDGKVNTSSDSGRPAASNSRRSGFEYNFLKSLIGGGDKSQFNTASLLVNLGRISIDGEGKKNIIESLMVICSPF